jgi:hypothetical protein
MLGLGTRAMQLAAVVTVTVTITVAPAAMQEPKQCRHIIIVSLADAFGMGGRCSTSNWRVCFACINKPIERISIAIAIAITATGPF